jgi:hypothetical protein
MGRQARGALAEAEVIMRDGRVAGVVLAAGSSSRLGSNKLLIGLGGETIVHRGGG